MTMPTDGWGAVIGIVFGLILAIIQGTFGIVLGGERRTSRGCGRSTTLFVWSAITGGKTVPLSPLRRTWLAREGRRRLSLRWVPHLLYGLECWGGRHASCGQPRSDPSETTGQVSDGTHFCEGSVERGQVQERSMIAERCESARGNRAR